MTRPHLLPLLALCLLPLFGCEFSRQYDQLANQPVKPAQPLIGAYSGTWHASAHDTDRYADYYHGGNARAYITTQSNSDQLQLALEFQDYHCIFSADQKSGALSLEPGSPITFHAKLPAGSDHEMTLTGQLVDQDLTLHYAMVDTAGAQVQHRSGTLNLHRD